MHLRQVLSSALLLKLQIRGTTPLVHATPPGFWTGIQGTSGLSVSHAPLRKVHLLPSQLEALDSIKSWQNETVD